MRPLLEVELLDSHTIGRVRGAKSNSYTAGVICGKVARYAERLHHPRGERGQPIAVGVDPHRVLPDDAVAIDPARREVRLARGAALAFLVVRRAKATETPRSSSWVRRSPGLRRLRARAGGVVAVTSPVY